VTDDVVQDELAGLRCELVAANERIAHLSIALESNRRIGAAMGILMTRHGLTDAAAFDALRVTSQHIHEKLVAVAERVILTGDLDPTFVVRPIKVPPGRGLAAQQGDCD
jgi:hypothetical protein